MKIELSYAIELLKKLEEHFPKSLQEGQLHINQDAKKVDAHLIYLLDESFIFKSKLTLQNGLFVDNYRINSKGINLLNGFDLKSQLTNH
ncbi:hypothetical protein [Commensalibacter papalotli (ex Botero et al. 2024)]|uniref:hypothetical protein n=1 Tax=Commensalibacter papalotli (ex Botero et al. 2024) TaxID=2972766 RepID=UPI0022FF719F|nr:hypothetical protein [Commensalibacter papalotli (ex Botero et al. 2024)]CAI3958364.1 unnamed protein product [Commensalibacter papalotli (ex Botero et al. 2024)]